MEMTGFSVFNSPNDGFFLGVSRNKVAIKLHDFTP